MQKYCRLVLKVRLLFSFNRDFSFCLLNIVAPQCCDRSEQKGRFLERRKKLSGVVEGQQKEAKRRFFELAWNLGTAWMPLWILSLQLIDSVRHKTDCQPFVSDHIHRDWHHAAWNNSTSIEEENLAKRCSRLGKMLGKNRSPDTNGKFDQWAIIFQVGLKVEDRLEVNKPREVGKPERGSWRLRFAIRDPCKRLESQRGEEI